MEYKRKVDKRPIPTCNIMGVNIAAINMEWLVDYLEKNISEIKGDYICVSNVHTTVTSFEDVDYCAIQNGGLMAIPDGGPLSTVGQKRGHKNMERTTGPSLMGEIFEISAKKGYRHHGHGRADRYPLRPAHHQRADWLQVHRGADRQVGTAGQGRQLCVRL